MNTTEVSSPIAILSQTLANLITPEYIFFANNADGRVYDGIVYGENEGDWIYQEEGLLPAILFLAEQHYKDTFIVGDYAVPCEGNNLPADFGVNWVPDDSPVSKTGYRMELINRKLAVSPAVILLFAFDVIERMHLFAYRQVSDWRFQIDDEAIHAELEQKKIVNVNGLMDLFHVLHQPEFANVSTKN